MSKRFVFIIITILLLSLWPAGHHDNGTALPEIVHTDANEPLVTLTSHVTGAKSAASSDDESSDSQYVVLKNPTFQELRDFLLKDPTSRNEFILNQYECRHFATDVNNNAEAEDLRSAFVLLGFDQGQHAVIAFDTTDRGLVYIEPQTDAAIEPKVGGEYRGQKIKEILLAW